jgi:hypothetical protein
MNISPSGFASNSKWKMLLKESLNQQTILEENNNEKDDGDNDNDSDDDDDDDDDGNNDNNKDDNNKNLLYMRDGRERYEGFRLYKMIARTVHNCIPEEQLDHYYFNQYEVLSIDGLDKHIIINIDSIPCYVN